MTEGRQISHSVHRDQHPRRREPRGASYCRRIRINEELIADGVRESAVTVNSVVYYFAMG
jgi:hypothetical protein